MKHIKKFESFDFSQTLPATSVSDLTSYYSCDECNALWKEVNKTVDKCKFCDSEEIEELSKNEWSEVVKSRLDDDEIEDFDQEMSKNREDLVSLFDLKKKRNYVN